MVQSMCDTQCPHRRAGTRVRPQDPPLRIPPCPCPSLRVGPPGLPCSRGPGTCLRRGRGKILVTSQMTPCCRAVGAQHREHLVPSGQDGAAPRGHVSCNLKGRQTFDRVGGRVLLQGAGEDDRLEADGGSFLVLERKEVTLEMGRFFPGPCSCRSSLPLRFQWEGLKGLWVQSPGLWVGICEPTLFPVW